MSTLFVSFKFRSLRVFFHSETYSYIQKTKKKKKIQPILKSRFRKAVERIQEEAYQPIGISL